jgi:hypothetical protein
MDRKKSNFFGRITGLQDFQDEMLFIGFYPVILLKAFIPACPG